MIRGSLLNICLAGRVMNLLVSKTYLDPKQGNESDEETFGKYKHLKISDLLLEHVSFNHGYLSLSMLRLNLLIILQGVNGMTA